MKYLGIIQARLSSTRLPAKIMLDLAGKPLVERVFRTVSEATRLDKVVVATSNDPSDDIVEAVLRSREIPWFRGDLNDVLKRFFDLASNEHARHIVRITADNPLMDGRLIDRLIDVYEESGADYAMFSNGVYGLSAEVFSMDALRLAHQHGSTPAEREHVTPYIREHGRTHIVDIDLPYRQPDVRATVDTLDDYVRMQKFHLWCQALGEPMTIDTYLQPSRWDQ